MFKKNTSNYKILIGVVVYNEYEKISLVIDKFKKFKLLYDYKIIFVDDGSNDGTSDILKKEFSKNKKVSILRNDKNYGVGYSIRRIINYGVKNKYDICVIMAGNGKDNPLEIPKLIKPIIKEGYDYIQGSRFLRGGDFKNLPFFRKIMIKGFTFIVGLFTGFYGTDATNGFRAYKLSIFKDKRININQRWLDRYELETYLHYKVITLGYKVKEVPVTKNYLSNVKKYSHIKPIIDWWKIIKPLLFLKFRLKK